MPKRTDEERAEIARRCREIEKGGGDVLGYIKSLGYISPRATWYNLQKEFLGRDVNHLTEGHPTEDKRQKTRQQMLIEIMDVIDQDGDPLAYLADIGYVNPGSAWSSLKKWAKEKGLDEGKLPDNLITYYKAQRARKRAAEKAAEAEARAAAKAAEAKAKKKPENPEKTEKPEERTEGRMTTQEEAAAEIARQEVRKYQIMIDGQRVAREVQMEMVGTFITGILSWHRDRAAEICIRADGKGEQ